MLNGCSLCLVRLSVARLMACCVPRRAPINGLRNRIAGAPAVPHCEITVGSRRTGCSNSHRFSSPAIPRFGCSLLLSSVCLVSLLTRKPIKARKQPSKNHNAHALDSGPPSTRAAIAAAAAQHIAHNLLGCCCCSTQRAQPLLLLLNTTRTTSGPPTWAAAAVQHNAHTPRTPKHGSHYHYGRRCGRHLGRPSL